MTQDFELIPPIADLVSDKTTGEPAFTFPDVIEVIRLCTANQIAVLGMEIFLIKEASYYASGCSTYDLQISRKWPEVPISEWHRYVAENNSLAESSVRSDPTGDDHLYILTTASWREFCEIQDIRRAGGP
jgi:hypothetical protein